MNHTLRSEERDASTQCIEKVYTCSEDGCMECRAEYHYDDGRVETVYHWQVYPDLVQAIHEAIREAGAILNGAA